VGARVRVHQLQYAASANPQEEGGTTGILVSQTCRTWRIVPIVESWNRSSRLPRPLAAAPAAPTEGEDTVSAPTTANTDAKGKWTTERPSWRLEQTVFVPKERSSLAVLIPLSVAEENGRHTGESTNFEPPRYLRIVLQANDTSKQASKQASVIKSKQFSG
jgi:hypothetical protein